MITYQVVIVGAGFGGLRAARALAGSATAQVLLLDQHNYHTFSPLLYQVASAALEAEEIAYPVRAIVRHYSNVRFKVAQVTGIDLAARVVRTDRGAEPYDYLIVAAGSATNFFGLPGMEEHSSGLKDLTEAMELRNRLLSLFELAAEEPDPERRKNLLTIFVVGGGPTGIELASAFAELASQILRRDFPTLRSDRMQIILAEASDRLLSAFRPSLSRAALATLRKKGIDVRVETRVDRVSDGYVHLIDGTRIAASLLVWAAGVRAADLARALAAQPGSAGRVPVLPTLQLADPPEVYVIGDMAEVRAGGQILPMLAPVAMQEGRLAGQNVARQIAGQPALPFRYRDRGTMATLGRFSAVAQVGPLSLTGFLAWLAWLALHIWELAGFRNRLLVLTNWAWDFFFFDRGVRIITDPSRPEDDRAKPQ